MKTTTLAALVLTITVAALGLDAFAKERKFQWRATGVRDVIEHDGKDRYYRLHVPESVSGSKEPVPLVVVLHGGGGTAEQGSKMGFTAVADSEGFIVVYPEATDGHWNDGRVGKVITDKAGENDDVGFIKALIEKIAEDHEVDPRRIYATGFSNGGMMSHRLGIEEAEVFAAIAPGIGGIPKPLGTTKKFQPAEPVSVLIMQSTEDQIVPYDGGELVVNFVPALKERAARDHGSIISTDATLRLWKKANGILGEPKVTKLDDTDKLDGCTMERSDWPTGRNGTNVSLIRVIGGGHTVPGMRQYLPEKIIGKTCQDADAAELIWDFFKQHPKKQKPKK